MLRLKLCRFSSAAPTVAVSCLLGLALQVQAESPPGPLPAPYDHEVLTIRGHLEIHRVERAPVLREFQFTLEGKQVGADEGYGSVAILARYPEKGPARVVLLELLTGGSGCPGFFKVLEIKEEGGILLQRGVRQLRSPGAVELHEWHAPHRHPQDRRSARRIVALPERNAVQVQARPVQVVPAAPRLRAAG